MWLAFALWVKSGKTTFASYGESCLFYVPMRLQNPVFHIGRRRQTALPPRRQLTHLPQTQANRAQPQQNTMRRHMIEQRAAPTQAQRTLPLARLQQRAAALAAQERESL